MQRKHRGKKSNKNKKKRDFSILILVSILCASIVIYHLTKREYELSRRPIYFDEQFNINGKTKEEVIRRYGVHYSETNKMYVRGSKGDELEPIDLYNNILDSLKSDTINIQILQFNRRKDNVLSVFLHNNIVFDAVEWDSKIVQF